MAVKVRDFIYMDVERLKSIVAQLEQGLVQSEVRTTGRDEEASAGIAGGILNVIKGSGEVRALWQDQHAETRSLHDYLYNKVESTLLEEDVLIILPDQIGEDVIHDSAPSEWLGPTSFVLSRGRVAINDFRHLKGLMSHYHDLVTFFARSSALDEDDLNKNQRKALERQVREQMQLDKKFLDGLQTFMEVFYGDRVIIKMVPYANAPDFRLVGNLIPDYLRDEIESITYKYGTSPTGSWTMLAQIAAIPSLEEHEPIPMLGGSELEEGMQQMFDSVRDIERSAQSVVWPEISVTPIAVYRE